MFAQAHDEVALSLFSENFLPPDEDNISAYLPRKMARRARQRKTGDRPRIQAPSGSVTLAPDDPRQAAPDLRGQREFIHLTNVISGAVARAPYAQASQRVKLDHPIAAGWIRDSRLPTWHQHNDLHSRLSVSCYPDAKGGFYDVPPAIKWRGQLRSFE